MKTDKYIGSIFWLSVGIFTAITSYQLGLGKLSSPGPGFIFFLASLFLIVLSIIDFAVAFKTEKGKEIIPIWSGSRWQKVLMALGGLSAYTYFLDKIGFYPCTFLLMLLLLKGVEKNNWMVAIVGSILAIMCLFFVFESWLKIPFPTGFLGF